MLFSYIPTFQINSTIIRFENNNFFGPDINFAVLQIWVLLQRPWLEACFGTGKGSLCGGDALLYLFVWEMWLVSEPTLSQRPHKVAGFVARHFWTVFFSRQGGLENRQIKQESLPGGHMARGCSNVCVISCKKKWSYLTGYSQFAVGFWEKQQCLVNRCTSAASKVSLAVCIFQITTKLR